MTTVDPILPRFPASGRAEGQAEVEAAEAPSPCVLIADDDELFAALLAARFRTTGMSPVVVTDGLEVLLQVARRPPDLILLDVQMPFADGLCIARKLAQHPELVR